MPDTRYQRIERFGNLLVDYFHLLGLFVIGFVIVWATGEEIVHIVRESGPSIKDILLLFIYLELGAMVGIYFKTKHLPVRFLLYIAITALTRVLAIDVKTMTDERTLFLSIAILVLSLAVLVIRVGSDRFPSKGQE
ncbi:MAG: phosphate-starvation-inducible PsiE family protein [Chromatiaceae bacterium]